VAPRGRLPTSPVHAASTAGAKPPTDGSESTTPDSTSSDRAYVPASADDWEAKKNIIEELYFRRNIRVQDVAEIMETAYRFKAT